MVDSAGPLSGWRFRSILWSVLVAAAGYLVFAVWSGWAEVAGAVARVGLLGVAVTLSLSLVNYGLRFLRWQVYLAALGHPVPCRPSLQIYLAGFALTTTPGKAGEALRGVLLKPRGIPYPKSLAAFLSERLSDLIAVVLLALVGLSLYAAARPVILFGTATVVTFLLLLSSQRFLHRLHSASVSESRLVVLFRQAVDVLLQARQCHTPLLLVMATVLSLLAWAAEAWAFALVLHWMELEVSLTFAVFVYAVSMLAGALSFMPGGLGSAEAAMAGLLVWSGADPPGAVAATLVIRLATLWFAVLIGLVTTVTVTSKQFVGPSLDAR